MAREQLVSAVLIKFAKYVIQQARTNLSRKKQNVTGDLYKSLSYNIYYDKNKFSVVFKMDEYGLYQDAGVRGAKSTYQSAAGSPYKYTNKQPPASAFSQWAIKKGLEGVRNKKGQFVGRKSLQFALARSIYEKGIPATKFFSTPFGIAFNRLPPDLLNAFKIDPTDFQ
jgi:hypothetical protein